MEVKADKGEWWGDKGEWNSSMIYIDLIHCKNVCKCHNVFPPSTTIQKIKNSTQCRVMIYSIKKVFSVV
jgi:hypothetical protein